MINIMLTKKINQVIIALRDSCIQEKKICSVIQNLPSFTSTMTLVWHLHMCCFSPCCFTEISNFHRKDWMFSQYVILSYYHNVQLRIKEIKRLKTTQGHRKLLSDVREGVLSPWNSILSCKCNTISCSAPQCEKLQEK